MSSNLEDVTSVFTDSNGDPIDKGDPLKAGETLKLKFVVKSSDGTKQNISGDSFTLKGWNVDTDTEIWSVNGSITDGSNGEVTFTVSASDNDTHGDFVLEFRQDVSDNGSVDEIKQGRHDLVQTTGSSAP